MKNKSATNEKKKLYEHHREHIDQWWHKMFLEIIKLSKYYKKKTMWRCGDVVPRIIGIMWSQPCHLKFEYWIEDSVSASPAVVIMNH